MKLTVSQIGDDTVVRLPAALLERLGIAPGDTLYVSPLADGIKLSPVNSKLAAQLEVVHDIVSEDADLLARLTSTAPGASS